MFEEEAALSCRKLKVWRFFTEDGSSFLPCRPPGVKKAFTVNGSEEENTQCRLDVRVRVNRTPAHRAFRVS